MLGFFLWVHGLARTDEKALSFCERGGGQHEPAAAAVADNGSGTWAVKNSAIMWTLARPMCSLTKLNP